MTDQKFPLHRRSLLAAAPIGALAASASAALLTRETRHETALSPDALPDVAGETFLTGPERRCVGAAFDRLIPADELSMAATEAGCVTFLDRQLAGAWGTAASKYRAGPFVPGTPEQGDQSPFTPRERYRSGLRALDDLAARNRGRPFADLPAEQQDEILKDMEAGNLGEGLEALFALMLQNVREGYFADPLYGGNKDMVGWKLVGFPGARYDYRLEIDRPGEDLGLAPVSLMDRS